MNKKMAIKVTVAIISNKWYFMHNGKQLIQSLTYVDENTSAIVPDGYLIEEFDTKEEAIDKLIALGFEYVEES
jgi:hypothetical protein